MWTHKTGFFPSNVHSVTSCFASLDIYRRQSSKTTMRYFQRRRQTEAKVVMGTLVAKHEIGRLRNNGGASSEYG